MTDLSRTAQAQKDQSKKRAPHILLVGPSHLLKKDPMTSLADQGFHILPPCASLASKRLLSLFRGKGDTPNDVDVVLIDLTASPQEAKRRAVHVRPFLNDIHSRHSTACVILIGPPLAIKDISGFLRHGVYDYLVPPFSPGSLATVIKRGLKNREQAQKMMSSLEHANRELVAKKDYFQRWSESLGRIYKINQSIAGYLNVDDLLCSFGQSIKGLLAYDTLSIFLKGYEEPDRAWIWAHTQSSREEEKKAMLQALHDETIRLGNLFLASETPCSETTIQDKGMEMLIPLFVSGERVGLLRITRDSKKKRSSFDDYQARILSMVTTPLCLTLQNARMYQQVNALASTDELTHVLNRRAFLHVLDREFKRSVRLQTPLAILLVDLDTFKGINDRFGHLVGDTVLKETAALLKQAVREIDVLARYGGEEFVVILTDGRREEAFIVAERIRRLMESHLFNKGKKPIRLTVSIGAASLSSSAAKNAEDLFHSADLALYRAKKNGRNRIEFSAYEEKD